MLLIIKTLVHCSEKQLAERLPMMVSISHQLRCYDSQHQLYNTSEQILRLRQLRCTACLQCKAQSHKKHCTQPNNLCSGQPVDLVASGAGVDTIMCTGMDSGYWRWILFCRILIHWWYSGYKWCRSCLYCVHYHLCLIIGHRSRH